MGMDNKQTHSAGGEDSAEQLEAAAMGEHACPCGSGFDFVQCCGMDGRNALNAPLLATVSLSNGIDNVQNLTPSLQSAIDCARDTADLFPARINFNEDRAYLVKMSLQWYQESVFLDPARLKGSCVIACDLAWLRRLSDDIPWQSTGYIFHTAFCGSTLMSQALASLYNSLPLREPEALGNLLVYLRCANLSQEAYNTQVQQVLKLLSRRFHPQQVAVVKANDYANPLMPDLLQQQNNLPLLFMYTPLAEFLAGCLKAQNRRDWIKQRYQAVQAFASQILAWPQDLNLRDDAYGEMAAVYWSYNVALFLRAWGIAPQRVRSLDFNQMLANPLAAVRRCADMFGLEQAAGIDPAVEIDSLFGVYSKNSRFKYSPQQRDSDIRRLLETHQDTLLAAESLARELLGGDYPQPDLPGNLFV